jgi:hypothetical protein
VAQRLAGTQAGLGDGGGDREHERGVEGDDEEQRHGRGLAERLEHERDAQDQRVRERALIPKIAGSAPPRPNSRAATAVPAA